jgi:hypothetical protein
MAKIAVECLFNDNSCPLESIGTPIGVAVNTVGTSGATTYGYRISAINSVGETLASATVTTTSGNASLTTSNFNRITWNRVFEATAYNVYGRTSGSELLISQTTHLHFDDTGAITPSGALPSVDTTGYDSSKINIGNTIKLNQDGSLSPLNGAVCRPGEFSTAIFTHLVWANQRSGDIDMVFFADNASAAPTRRIVLSEYNKKNGDFSIKGFITLTFPPATNHTIRGFNSSYNVYTTGSVAVSGTAVTGTNTTWSTDRLAVGSRIGFGSTDPSKITRWYEISAIGSNTSITLTASVDATITAGTAYCIEDLRLIITTTNATTTNGGLFVVKGLREELFTSVGTTIPAATTVDNIRAVYWLADASTVTNITACGSALENFTDWQTEHVYVVDGTSNPKVFKYNTRAALTVASGKSTNALVLSTNTQSVTGTISQYGNGRVVTAGHGPGSGTSSLYYATTTRIYRAAISNITNANATWNSDNMTEVPPGGTSTFALTNLMNSVDYIPSIDRFIVYTSGALSNRHYIASYGTGGGEFSSIFAIDTKQSYSTLAINQAAPTTIIGTSSAVAGVMSHTIGDLTYYCRSHASSTLYNQVLPLYLGSDCKYSNVSGREQAIVTPELDVTGNQLFYRFYINSSKFQGDDRYNHIPVESYDVWYRTSGISDNSGSWTLAPVDNIYSISPSNTIQFKIKFKTIGAFGIPAKLYSLCVVCENSVDIPSIYKWNFDDTNNTNGTVGFVQTHAWGKNYPALQIDYYRSDNDVNVLSQDSTSNTNGDFEFWNESFWDAGVGSDFVGKRIRFVPTAALPTGVNLYARLTVLP